jgi:hypothetical protein
VDNTYAHFSYGSDFLTDGDYYYAWNFIKNNDNQELAVNWEKAGIRQISSPIAPGRLTCQMNPIGDRSDSSNFGLYIDRNAPISYSSANQEQQAWVFAAPLPAPPTSSGGPSPPTPGGQTPSLLPSSLKKMFSRFTTSYVDLKGGTRDVDVTIESALSSDGLHIGIVTNPDLTIGIANLLELLGPDGFKVAFEGFEKQGFDVHADTLVKYAGSEAAKRLLGNDERTANDTFLLLQGKNEGAVVIPLAAGMQLERKTSTMVLLDQDHHFAVADPISLYGLLTK